MDAVNSPEPAGTDLTAPEFAARLRRETEPGERRRLLAEALRDFLVRAGALGADAGPETPAVLESLAAVELNAVLDACLGLDTELETLRGPVSAGELAARLAERLPEAAVQAPVEGAADGPGGRPGDGAGGPSAGEPGEAPGRAGDGNASGGTARAVAPGPERRHEPFGLTDLQQAYLLGRSGDYPLATPAVCLVELDAEDLDVERLEAAWQTMIARHPMLRTVCTGDGTRQRVLPESETPPYRIARHDLRDRTEPERERHLDALREEFRARDRAPHVWPLFDVAVTRLDARRSRVHLTVDLLVADGPSIRRLLGEWLAAAAGREPEPVPDAGFREWVRALEEREDGPAFAAAWKYWLTRVPDLPDAPALPMRVAPEAVEVPRASARTFRLDGAAWARLRRHALDRGLTPSMALCWAYGAVLRTWSGQDRCTLNVTVNDRSLLPGLDRALGAFTSQLLLEVADDAAEPVRERIGTVQERFWADFAHRAFSGVRVLRELARRSGGGPAAVPYVFDAVLGGPDLDAYGLPEWYRGLSHLSASAPQVAVECQVFEVEGELRVHWGVVEELFPPGLIDTAFSAFTGLVEDLADEEVWDSAGLSLVPASDLAAREAANATDGPLPQALLHELGGPLRDRGDHPAVLTPDRTLTYAELDTRAARIAHHLRTDRNAKPGELVAIVMHKGWEQAVAALGILQSGAAYLPLDAAWPTRRLHHILHRTDCRTVLTQNALAESLDWPEGITVLAVDDDRTWAAASDAPPEAVAGPDDLAYTIFTSGSTGEPKGVMIGHQAAANTVTDINTRYHLGPDDRVLGLSSLSFDLSVWDLFGTLAAGATLVLPGPQDQRDPAVWTELMLRHEVSVWNSVPALMDMLTEHALPRNTTLPALRLVLLSGDWIPLTLPPRIHTLAPHSQQISLGGATEAAIWSIHHPIPENPDPTWTSIPYGKPLTNQTLHILDTHGNPTPTWTTGHLHIAGKGLAHGYWKNPHHPQFHTHPTTGQRLYNTGDLARYHPDGTIEFLGRTDHQIKLHGHRIELGEIHHHLTTHPHLTDALLTTTHHTLTAYLTTDRDTAPDEAELLDSVRRHLAAVLPPYMLPAQYVVLDAFPLTPNGKIDRTALPAPRPAEDTDDRGDGRPRTLREERLAAIWCALLDRQEIGVHTDFFQAGGDSLLAVRVAAAASAAGLPLTPGDLLAHPTIAGQAALLTGRGDGDGTPGASGDQGGLPEIEPDPEGRYAPFPLTDLQQAYLLGRGEGFALGGGPAVFSAEIDVADLDVERLEAAWQTMIARHAMLRTVCTGDGTRQRVLPESETPPYRIARHDLRDRPEPERERHLGAVRERLAHRVRRPDAWPLFEIATTRLDARHTRLHLAIDLLVTDGASLGRLLHEWGVRYQRPDAVPPAPPEVSFRDYVRALERLEDSPAYAQARDHWLARLPDLPEAPALPTRKAPGSVRQPRFTTRTFRLDGTAWTRLRQRALGHGLTPSMALCWAYAAVLRTWSGQDRCTLNVTVNDRLPLHPEIDRAVGEFTSVVLLAAEFDPAAPVHAQARALQDRFWADFAHRAFSGVRVLRELARREGAERAVMPVVFTSALGDGGTSLGRAAGAFGELVHTVTQTPQVSLDCQVFEVEGELRVHWGVVEELFPPGLIDTAFSAFTGLVEDLAQQPDLWETGGLNLVPASDLAAREAANATDGPLPQALLHELGGPLRDRGDHPAVLTPDRTLSYAELDTRAARIAHHLRTDRNAKPGELVAIVMHKGWEQAVAALGILQSGAAYLPLDAAWPTRRLHHILHRTDCRTVLTQSALAESLDWPEGITVLAVDDDRTWAAASDTPPEAVAGPDDLAYTIFTSGSTGEPKGVMIGHQAAANTVTDINTRYHLGPEDRVLGLSSLSFDLSVWDLFGTLAAGATLVLPGADEGRDPAAWLETMERNRVSVWNSVPALMDMLTEHALPRNTTLPALRLVLLSGDWIPLTLPPRIHTLAPRSQQISLGGATEAAIWSIHHPIPENPDPTWTSIPYGKPLTNQTLHIHDTHGNPTPTWTTGHLHIAGKGLAHGYWKNPHHPQFHTHPTTGDRLYNTGDLARYHPDGTIEFLGRTDHQIKLHGHRIELGEIHHHLTTHPHLTDALLTTTHHTLTAYLTTGDTDALADPDALIADVRRSLAEALPDYMVPRQYVVLDAFPLTPNGKIDRTALPTPRPAGRPAEPADEPGADDPDAEREPRNDIERRLRDIWAEVLGRESVGVHEVFGDAGGDSLLALRVIARAADAGLTLTPRQFFAHPTVAGLARVAVLAAPRTGQPDAGAAAEAGGEAPLLPGQRMLLSGTDAERNAETVRHHNYALFFSLDAPLDKVALRVALRTLVARHDTLRTGFAGGPEGWRQHVRPAAEKRNVPVEWLDLSGLEPAEQDRTIEEHARRAQRSFDLAEPPLLRVLYADRGPGARPELLLTAHRLVVDNFSLRLLLDELLTAHAQIAEEGEAELPPVSLPASAWARMRAEHAAAPEEPAGPAAPSYGRAGDAETLIEVVDAGAVARLRERARDGATMGDVVLAALAAAARGCGRGGTLRVDVDGHGRTGTPPGSGAAEADLSRTLGRLSVRHRLCLRGVSGPEEAVAAVVAARRAATGGDPDGVREDGEAAGEPPEFLFNHLGAVDELFAVPGLEPSALHPGPLVHPDTPLRHRFELLCGTVEDELLIGLTFPAGDRQEARALLKGLLAEVAAGAPAAPAGRARSQRGRALAEMYRRWLAPGTPG